MRPFALLLALLTLALPAAAAPFEVRTVHPSERHPTIVLAPRDAATAALLVWFRAGAYDDGERPGLTRLSQHVLLESNARGAHGPLVLDLLASAGELSFETGVRESSFLLVAPRADFDALAARLLTMLLAPQPTSAGFAAAQTRTRQDELRPDGGSELLPMLAGAVLKGAGYANPPFGTRESVLDLELGDVRKHLAGPMSPANAVVYLTGAFDEQRLVGLLRGLKGGERRPADRPDSTGLAGIYHLPSLYEVHLMAYPLLLDSRRSVAAAQLTSAILEERIQRTFRRMGIAYATSVSVAHREWMDFLLVVLPVQSTLESHAAERLQEVVDQVRTGELQGDELQRNLAHLQAERANIDGDPKRLALELANGGGDLEWYGPEVAAELAHLDGPTLAQVMGPRLRGESSIHVQLSLAGVSPAEPAAQDGRADTPSPRRVGPRSTTRSRPPARRTR